MTVYVLSGQPELKFHKQTAHIVNTSVSILGIIMKCFKNLDEHTVPILYITLVRSILEYGNIIWGPTTTELNIRSTETSTEQLD